MRRPIYLFSTSSHPEATSINSLEIKFLKPQIDFSKYDYLIITSRQSVEALKQYDKKDFVNKKAFCISKKSAESYENIDGKVLEVGDGYGDNFSKVIKKYPKDTKWLYLRAKVVASNFVQACKSDGLFLDEAIVYESQCSHEILEVSVEDDSILIFTSPSSLECFLKTHTISENSSVIVIGKTTAKAVPKNIDYIISDQPTIENCMQMALHL